jgi:hypothetical protein
MYQHHATIEPNNSQPLLLFFEVGNPKNKLSTWGKEIPGWHGSTNRFGDNTELRGAE